MALAIFLSILSLFSPPAGAAPRTAVLMFGGFGTSQAQMECWRQAAQGSPAGSRFAFQGYAYPSSLPDEGSGRRDGAPLIRAVVEALNAHPGQHYVLVGHSAGSGLANEIARLAKHPERLKLVNLDGYAPSGEVLSRVPATCWWVENPRLGLRSLLADGMVRGCGRLARRSVDLECRNHWCLHVSLFEKNIPADLDPLELPRLGLRDCVPNLEWLPSE